MRLRAAAAFALALHILGMVKHLLREEEHKDAFDEFYRAARAAIEAYEQQTERERQRLFRTAGRN